MAGETTGLSHVPSTTQLSARERVSLIARGRRDASRVVTHPLYTQAVEAYQISDMATAVALFRAAAADGHAESQYMLSTMLDGGEAEPAEPDEAAAMERKAAGQGHAYAQANLSYRCYSQGNFAEAFTWCMRAAESKLAWAQFHLGLMYRKGEGVQQSDKDAAAWYRLAADQDHAEAQQKLADMYTFGQGVPQSFAQAAVWYRRAAEQGNAEAQFQLGHLYATGQGVDHDYTQSRRWTREAAMQGHEAAMKEQKRREYRDA